MQANVKPYSHEKNLLLKLLTELLAILLEVDFNIDTSVFNDLTTKHYSKNNRNNIPLRVPKIFHSEIIAL